RTYLSLLNQADLEQHTPKVTTFKMPENTVSLLDAQVIGPTSEHLIESDFPEQSFKPKVQIAFETLPGKCPRTIEIERKRKLYLSLDINQLLDSEGIDSNQLTPRHHDPGSVPDVVGKEYPIYLPLKIFDDEEYDCRTPEEWISLGLEPGSHERKPVPGKALLPTDDVLGHEDPKSQKLTYEWIDVGVLDYDKETKLYLVHKLNKNGLVRDEEGRPVLHGGATPGRAPLLPCQYWVPRVYLQFLAEDPRVFAQRIISANNLRKKTQMLLLYHLYVDCMPTDGLNSISETSMEKMKLWALHTPNVNKNRVLDCMGCLEKEVKLDFQRAMNRMIFDRAVTSKPQMFSYVTLPDKEERKVPEKGLICIPDYPYDKQREAFSFISLLTRPEVIHLLAQVQDECNKVVSMTLFNTSLAEHISLEEFDDIQTQTFTQVQDFLKDTWIDNLRTAVKTSLRDAGIGWYNLERSSWDVYQMSKLHQLMKRIQFIMQDSVRFLVQKSLIRFVQLLLDACHGVLNCSEDMEWGDDLINSPYRPRRNPTFVIDLVLDDSGAHFSPPEESFKESLLSLLDKGILATHGIPQLEKYVVENVPISGTPCLDSVDLHELEVEERRAVLQSAIEKALIPLRAYAKKYEKFLELNNNDIQYFLKDYQEQCPSALEVTDIVNNYLSEKEDLDNSLPISVIIGPFTVRVGVVKQNLIKKYETLATSMLDLLAENLHSKVESICGVYDAVSSRIHEKPNNIEELTELREWMKGVPDQLAVQEDLISEVMEDYKVLEEFLYNLTDGDFNDKWTASYWPLKIAMQTEAIQLQHMKDEKKFREIQVTDHNVFEEKLEDMQLTVGEFSVQVDVKQAHTFANEARLVEKQLKELQSLAVMYNNREKIFGMPITNYKKLTRMVKDFQPYCDLWTTVSDWLNWCNSWMDGPLTEIEAEQLEKNVNESFKTMQKCVRQFKNSPACQGVATEFRDKIEEFKLYVPLIQGLNNPGMGSRHWKMLSEEINMDIEPDPDLTLRRCLDMELQDHIETITKIAEIAGKEYAIESALDKMESEWSSVLFAVSPYKDTGTFILKDTDEASQLLDDHIVMTQSMSFSPFKKHFEERMNTWENKLKMTQDVLDEWLNCQCSWLYLEPIFSSEDIKRQLPEESERFDVVDKDWRIVMKKANENPEVMSLCPDPALLESLKKCNKLLELVQKGLSEYLETKRGAFPRFYFLSDDELLEILSQTKDPTAVQPHLRKCFENIARLQFQEDLQITHMYSSEGEEVELSAAIYPTENVEEWLLEVEKSMKASVRDNIERSVGVYPETPRTTWVLQWPGQVTIVGCQIFWTKEVSEALESGDLSSRLFPQLSAQLADLVAVVRGQLSKMQRAVMSALIVIEVHAKDVAAKLIEENVASVNDFEWISQLRSYWTEGDLYIRAVNAEFLYGYEYLGNTGRLVITPLTDRCYLTLTGALHLKFGGAPAGPAGTGKTETTKELGKALAVQTVVFNCSDQLDFMAMGKFFKGLASSGAWACFDEFNRIDMEVLSVVAQQITTIQKAQQKRVSHFMFEGKEIPLVPSCAVFITMNPGYAGRTELPENLKALFRPVAMMVPDYSMIAEISLYSFGFNEAKVLAKKITTTFKLLSEQLSSQDHYDFGMRAVKTVISTAGNLKKENPTMDEDLICLRAIRDANIPKFLQDDLKLFRGIVSDLFPKIKEQPVDYGILEEAIRKTCINKSLKDVDGFVTKCIQLYETTVVRHGLMLVGPAGSGKTKCYEVLAAAMTSLQGQPAASGGNYEPVSYSVLNPKSITMGQLYGEFNLLTHEWTDGILSSLIRQGAMATDNIKKWYMFDGPVDALWIENMNTVLDDNKKLCLSSGEIIKMTESMTMMFEVQDLAVASPATVSRCGMVYLEPSILGLEPFTECWLQKLPDIMKRFSKQLTSLFSRFLKEAIGFVRESGEEIIASTDGNLTRSLLVLLECLFQPYVPTEGVRKIPKENLAHLGELIEPWFIFALIWSVGATGDSQGRVNFNLWLREKMAKEKLLFPEEGLVYDYKLTAGFTSAEDDLDEEVVWEKWLDPTAKFTMVPDTNYCDIIVPTVNTVRMAHLLELLLINCKPVLCIGPTGTGKTLTITDKLLKSLPLKFISHFLTFSAQTSANQTQDLIDSKLEKRRKGVFGPAVGRYFIFFIDDLNMPTLETYGAQPPIELLRQWMDHKGWYDRKLIGTFKKLVDINFVCAMGPPGGGRNAVTPRFTRHFNYLSFTEMDDDSKKTIFSNILGSWMGKYTGADAVKDLNKPLVDATIYVYLTITSQLLPTPTKSHYTFNLRDLSKVFQGMLMAQPSDIKVSPDKTQLLRLWYHESWGLLGCPIPAVLFGDFMEPGAHIRLYEEIESPRKEYNQTSTGRESWSFHDAMQHICRITGSAFIGCDFTGFSSFGQYECFQIELSRITVMMKAGLQSIPKTFLFVDTQIKSEFFLRISNLLNSGDIPNIYRRVRSNIHMVLCMSPIGEVFRARLRQFPSLVNCCTIDWFNEWPAEALQCVAFSFLHENPHLGASTDTVDGMVRMCVEIHQSVAKKCLVYLAELGRHNYVTPKSYLDFLNIFCSLIGKKKEELKTAKNRMEGGLDKLLQTADDVAVMQEELESARPLLAQAAKDTEATMEQLQVDTAVAEETRTAVQAEEEKANEKAQKAQAIADDAQKDLAEALPALDAALASLRNLKKNDVTEVRAMQRPPPGVKMVIEAVCIMKEIKPKKVAGEKLGTKVDDYWEPGRGLLQDPGKFLDSLFKYDKDNIPDAVIKAIQPYIDSKDFQPAAIAKVSKACTSICQWVRAMHKYHFVAKVVEPKRQALREAEEDLRATQEVLDEAKQRLQEVENGIAALQAKYNGCIAKKEELEMKCEQCQQRLGRAATLINSLADEKVRWKDTVENLDYKINNIAGDVLLAAGFVAYLGPFTGQYRVALCNEWLSKFSENNIPHTEEPNLISTLGDPVEIRSWQVAGLPNDMLSVENGVITRFSQRWTHYIDPQRQANKWIKNLEKANSLEVAKMSDRDFLSSLEKAITYGKPFLLENVGEELDPALEPILLKQTYKQQGRTVLKLGDTVIPYNEDFKLYITTNLSNPHYSPEISTKVTLINFTISPSGLEDQLLGQVVAEERPDLEEARNQLILSNAEMQQELKEIEDQILHRLSTSEGNPVDDLELISALEASKIKAGEIQTKVKAAEQTEVDINTTRLQYAPVAVRAQILYFCVSDLSSVDPMYQYSLEWFLNIFLMGISNSEKADTVKDRIVNINNYLTFSLYCSVCRSLFEKHKLMFAFLVCSQILMNDGRIDMDEWRYLLSGGTVKEVQENPAPDWLNERAWGDILALSNLKNFSGFAGDFAANLESFRAIFDSQKPHRQPLPGKWDTELDAFQKLLVLRCLRGDKITNAMQDFVALNLDRHFIEPQTTDLSVVFKESSSTIPLVFVLSPGTDPAADLYKFAAEMRFSEKLSAISLGQGQGPRAEAMMCSAMKKGNWVFFQNCHLAPSWMPSLERLIECIDPNEVHQNFRLWLTSLPSNHFPVSILQNSSKMTIEPPRGVKANLLKSYISFSDNFLNSCPKVTEFKSLLLSLCFFHGNMLERRKFGPLGFNIPYEFTDGDLRICISQLNMFLSEYKEVPYKVLKYTAGEINYGGRVTDDWDRRCMMNILEDFYKPEVLTPEFAYSESGVYRQISTSSGLDGYLQYIRSLPLNDSPELFGLHDNANITFAQKETFALLGAILQPHAHMLYHGWLCHPDVKTANEILAKLPDPMDVQEVVCKYPLLYEESMNTVLVQEVISRLLWSADVSCLVQGVLSPKLEGSLGSSATQTQGSGCPCMHPTPSSPCAPQAYPSLKPLASWVNDLVQRVEFLQKWISHGIPPVFWISGFFFPQAFLTGTLQNFARRSVISIDNISFGFEVMKESPSELSCPPSDGCYIYGLFLEGARWDPSAFQLAESRPKELYSEMAVIWLLPVANRKPPAAGVYLCPIYKTLTRAGTLSTTGHSTNYVIAVEIPTDKPEKHWIKRGTALICALDF
uniref:Dynein axonemal heavy chain 1 n=1 Tax=Coturnix japonica TaxID=93934 RepID=A0A8C2YBK7_COTJA